MLSVIPILALAFATQAEPAAASAPASIDAAIAIASAPAPDAAPDDLIGDLMQQQAQEQQGGAPPAPPAAVAVAPPPAAPVVAPTTMTPPTVYARPAPQPYVPAPPIAEDEDAAEAMLPAAPRPYTSLTPTPSVRSHPTLFTNPMVRMPAAPQGLLDGGWILARPDGKRLYSFQFNDSGGGREIEGAWRNLGREWSTLGSGPVSSVSVGYEESGVTIRFYERDHASMSVVQLQRTASGDWTGELRSKDTPTQVVLRRD